MSTLDWSIWEVLGDKDLPFERKGRGLPFADPTIKERVKILIRDAVDDIRDEVYDLAVKGAPKGETGNLKDAINKNAGDVLNVGVLVQQRHGNLDLFPTRAVVGVDPLLAPYAAAVHGGTGIFGPHHTMIVAKEISEKTGKLKLMKWETKGKTFYAEEVKGQKPQPFMRDAYEVVSKGFAPARILRLKEEIGNLG